MSNQNEIREYKSNSFSLLLKQKEYALEIYNALNGSSYDNPEDVEILELEGAFSLTIHGDAEFVIGNDLNLYEHQSTRNPNMPLRFLIYVAKAYKEIVRNKNLFGTILIHVPNPRFVVFYNGTENLGERIEYKLSDAFENKNSSPELELKCVCININPGYNEDIKKKSIAISGYMHYVEKVRKYSKSMDLKPAVIRAVDECIEEGILTNFFKENREMIISDDPIDGTFERREKFAREEGREEGRVEGRVELILRALNNGKSPKAVAEFNDIPLEQVMKVYNEKAIIPTE